MSQRIAIIGAGPAGLIAAEKLSSEGFAVDVYERMPSVARKFLMAGRGGLNLTHSETLDAFLKRYDLARDWLEPAIRAFPPAELVAWCEGLGQAVFTGSSGRIFPKSMKATPLLRAWLARLDGLGVTIHTRHSWRGFDGAGRFLIAGPDGLLRPIQPDAVVLALGGASWPRLGSKGDWTGWLSERGVEITPFTPSNAGFNARWSAVFKERFAGEPLKTASFSHQGRTLRGEAMITAYGMEGGAIYALSASLRTAIEADGKTVLTLDLAPDISEAALANRLGAAKPGQSLSNTLRKQARLSSLSAALLREMGEVPRDPAALAARIKALPLTLTGMQGLERAISSAGGVARASVDDRFMLKALPGVFVAGEMLDWEAPTGGYLLQACFASGVAAAQSVARYLTAR
ncbi:MAG: TIGR03862 family flavoprotein [Oceanicaulis sp.]|uniref:TIGR03862 family flavoprotein n=1 Tax=Glycocaulis sp. TaxID=1969725 RepID=UPI0025C3F096|nr:TIGR03862 family flavoprotein [Glycocaulis sp.]MCC5980805.1 TIGR03862 family flavoprotein [Oceanicaulis sp.]MCH8521636.1 TIGR03862 family flavoprotein [Glycocaulis sp.]